MGFRFDNPWLLLILIPVIGWTIFCFIRYGKRSLKDKVAVTLRSFACLLLVLALSGTSLVMSSKKTQLLVLSDLSQSVKPQIYKEEELLVEIQKKLPKSYEFAVLGFGGDTVLENRFEDQNFDRFGIQVDDQQTNFEQALSFASSFFAKDKAKHLLILSDGQQNAGEASKVVQSLKEQGIRIDTMMLESHGIADAQISDVRVPDNVFAKEQFDIIVQIDSLVQKDAKLFLYGNDQLMGERSVSLQKGKNTFVFQDQAKQAGIVSYKAVLQEIGESIPQNNQKSTTTKVLGTPKVMIVESETGQGESIRKMLEAVGIDSDVIFSQYFPSSLGDIQQYGAIVLANVDATKLSDASVKLMDQFVKELGHGLITIGGDQSYALGSYIGSDLEKMLPVDSNIRNKIDMPSLGLLIVLDKSGSMMDGQFGVTKLSLAVEATQRAVEILSPQDQIGVITFDDTAQWVVKMRNMDDLAAIQDLIGSIRPGGGTMMYASLVEANKALKSTNTVLKHVILLTDGQPADSGFEKVVNQMKEDGITLSSVAVGQDANGTLLKKLADLGNGRFYQTNAFDDIPSIFTKETQLATQSYIQNRDFFPAYAMSSPTLQKFEQGLPELHGFLGTVAKPLATVALMSDNDLPILAHWQYGAGQVVCWTSDATGSWTSDFLKWDQSASFFGAMVSYALRLETGQGYLQAKAQNSQVDVSLDVPGLDDANTQMSVLGPNGERIDEAMMLTKPGQFTTGFKAEKQGYYAIEVKQTRNGEVVNVVQTGVSIDYSAEFDIRLQDGESLMQFLSTTTGGKEIVEIADLFSSPLAKVERARDISYILLWTAFFICLLDMVLRRLQWEQRAQVILADITRRLQAVNVNVFAKKQVDAERILQKKDFEDSENQKNLPQTDLKQPKDKKKKKPKDDDVPLSEQLLLRKKK